MKDIYVDFGSSTSIIGDSMDTKHPKTVEVSSFNHIIRQPRSATASSAGGHTAERVEFGDLVFTKDIDLATPYLMAATCSGTLVKEIKIYFYRAYGGNSATGTNSRVCYYTLVLVNTIISSVTTAIGAEGLPIETFTLKPAAMSWKYVQHKPDGTSTGTITKQWSLATNSASMAGQA
jgi:type VI secretion system secreted protein Hcp